MDLYPCNDVKAIINFLKYYEWWRVNILNDSEEIIARYFTEKGFIANRFNKGEMKAIGKTPDFKVLKDNKLILYCEVKEINEDNREFKDGSEKDNTYNIVSECIN